MNLLGRLFLAAVFFLCTFSLQAEIRLNNVILPGPAAGFSSPAVADVDGNPANGLEIVQTTGDGVVHAISSTGQILWSSSVPNANCVGPIGNRIHSTPAVGLIDNSKIPAVVITYGAIVSRGCDGGAAAFRGSDGALLWNFSLKQFSKKQHFWSFRYSAISTPALADVDGDGIMEIGFGAFDRNIYLLNGNGTPRWYYQAADTVWSSPLFTNTDGKGNKELVAATDISKNTRLKPATPNGGYLYAFSTAQRRSLRVGFRDPSLALWRNETDQVLYSSPIAADVIPSNPGREIIIASGCFFPQNSSSKSGRWIKVFDEKTGALLRTLPTPACSSSSPAVGDLDGDGVLEIVAFIQGSTNTGGSGQSHLLAFKAESGTTMWNIVPTAKGANNPLGGDLASPVIADLDGNGSMEVVVGNSNGLTIVEGSTGNQLSCRDRNCNAEPSFDASGIITSTPAVADLNGDGALELIANTRSGLQIWSNLSGSLGSQAGPLVPFSASWPMARGNAQHSGER